MRIRSIPLLLCLLSLPLLTEAADPPEGAAAPPDAAETNRIVYFLPKTRIRINATIQRRTDANGDVTNRSVTADFSLLATSDITHSYLLDPSVAALSNTKTVLNLTPDGRLSSIDSAVQGQGGVLVKSIFRGVATILGLGGRGLPFANDIDATDEMYKTDHPTMAERRAAYRDTEHSLALKLAQVSSDLAAASGKENLDTLQHKVSVIEHALQRIRAEMVLVDNHFSAWTNLRKRVVDQHISRIIEIDSLPTDTEVSKLALQTKNPTKADFNEALGGSYLPVFRQLGFILTRSAATPAPPPSTSTDRRNDRQTKRISYRVPYPVTLCLYNTAPAMETRPVLISCRQENVLGPSSPIVNLPLRAKAFGRRHLIAVFDDSGSVKSITNDVTSAAADVADVVQGVPAEILAAFEQANKILDANRALALQDLEDQIEQTKAAQSLLEQQIALRERIAASATDAQLNELQRKLSVLEAQRNLLAATSTPHSTIVSLEDRQRLLALENAIREAEIRSLQLEKQLDEIRASLDND